MFALLARFVMIFMAVSLIRSVINAVSRAFRGPGATAPRTRPVSPPGSESGQASAATLLHQDPVCGTYVAAASSLRKICNGKVYHFCSDACRDKFNG